MAKWIVIVEEKIETKRPEGKVQTCIARCHDNRGPKAGGSCRTEGRGVGDGEKGKVRGKG